MTSASPLQGSPTFKELCEKKYGGREKTQKTEGAKRKLGLDNDQTETSTSKTIPSPSKEVESECSQSSTLSCCPQCRQFLRKSKYDEQVEHCTCTEKKYPVEDFENEELANEFVCIICRLIPIYPLPIVTACNHHLFCQSCLSHWLFQDDTTDNCSLGVCPLCRDPIGDF